MEGKNVRKFARDVNAKINTESCWLWGRRSDRNRQIEAFICAAQEQALRTNCMKCRIDNTAINSECAMRGGKRYGTSLMNARNWHNVNTAGVITMWQERFLGSSVEIKAYVEERRGMRKHQKLSKSCRMK